MPRGRLWGMGGLRPSEAARTPVQLQYTPLCRGRIVSSFQTTNFELEISDLDRQVYASEHIAVAQHPSETTERLVTRILAYALEYTEGIRFAGDLSAGDEPAAWVHDLTGALTGWVEVGTPAPERLHRATKAADRVAVYNHKEREPWLSEVKAYKIFRPDRLWITFLPSSLIGPLAARLDRRNRWAISRTEGVVYLNADGGVLEAELETLQLSER